jgi:tRNA A37 N6-isopentenylltransferase MiaA
MLNKDFILCHDGSRLFIVGYGAITSGGKNTYNYEVKDNEKNVVLSSGSDAYLDALTKIVLGSSPKAKANNEKSESEANKHKDVSLVSEFKKLKSNLAKAIDAFNSFQQRYNVITLNDIVTLEEKTIKKNEELNALRMSLDIAKQQGNSALIDAINEMIANKEKE